MKRYRLLKDLPFAKAGEIFKEWTGERDGTPEKTLVNENNITTNLWVKDIDDFDDWFEEIRTSNEYYYVIDVGHVGYLENRDYRPNDTLGRMKIGNIFETREQAEKYLEYLKAKEVIIKDTKGFRPDWEDDRQEKFYGRWDYCSNTPFRGITTEVKEPTIYFKTEKALKESFTNNPKEWKTYLTYER